MCSGFSVESAPPVSADEPLLIGRPRSMPRRRFLAFSVALALAALYVAVQRQLVPGNVQASREYILFGDDPGISGNERDGPNVALDTTSSPDVPFCISNCLGDPDADRSMPDVEFQHAPTDDSWGLGIKLFATTPGDAPHAMAGLLLPAEPGLAEQFGTPRSSGRQACSGIRVAFVCDGSVMLSKGASFGIWLTRTINSLRPSQFFCVIPIGVDIETHVDARVMVPATRANKRDAVPDGLVSPGGLQPVAALQEAFGQHPDYIYLITDGDFPDNKQVLAAVRSLSKTWHAHIHTVAFVGSEDADVDFIDLLKQIAAETNGQYHHVMESAVTGQ